MVEKNILVLKRMDGLTDEITAYCDEAIEYQCDSDHTYYTKGIGYQQLVNEFVTWLKEQHFVKQIPIDETTPVQWVGCYVTRWGHNGEPQYGFYEPDWEEVIDSLLQSKPEPLEGEHD